MNMFPNTEKYTSTPACASAVCPFMRLIYIVLFLFLLPFTLPAQTVLPERTAVPPLLAGIWENETRLILFGNALNAEQESVRIPLTVVLKIFYGWYYDRAAEPASAALPKRDINDTEAPNAEHLTVTFIPLIPETADSGAWNMAVSYPGQKLPVYIPVAVFNGSLYLDFKIASLPRPEADDVFWKASSHMSAISIDLPSAAGEVYSLYQSGNAVYRIRYWQTDMPYNENALAVLNDADKRFSFPKQLLIGSDVYTCVPGLGIQVRNAEKFPHDFSQYTVSSDGRICAPGKPYAVLSEITDLYAEIEKMNRRQRPPRKPPLPYSDLDFHYEIVEELRKYAVGL